MRQRRQVCSATLSCWPSEVQPLRITILSLSAARRNVKTLSISSVTIVARSIRKPILLPRVYPCDLDFSGAHSSARQYPSPAAPSRPRPAPIFPPPCRSQPSSREPQDHVAPAPKPHIVALAVLGDHLAICRE